MRGFGLGFVVFVGRVFAGLQVRLLSTVRQNNMVVGGRVAKVEGTVIAAGATVTLGLVVVVDPLVVDPLVVDPLVGATVVDGMLGEMTAGVGKLAGQGRTCGSGLAVSSGGQFGPMFGEIHWYTCQLRVSPTRAPRGQRPGHALFHVTVNTADEFGLIWAMV